MTEKTAYDGGLIGVNSFGLGGTNGHLILEAGRKRNTENVTSADPTRLPTLVPLAGMTEASVRKSLEDAMKHMQDPEYVYLLQSAFGSNIPGFTHRGYGLLGPGLQSYNNEEDIQVKKCSHVAQPPLWVIFPGLGTHWVDVGKELMSVEAFAESILRSKSIMKNIGMIPDGLLDNSFDFSNTHRALVATTAVQIALWDTLRAILPQLSSSGLIGHSCGEYLCAYADDCLSAEETLLIADARGRVINNERKSMQTVACVDLLPEKIKLPRHVRIACVNSPRNVIITGPTEAIKVFTQQLKDKGSYATILGCCDAACHSLLLDENADLFMQYAKEIIPDSSERARSPRWVSTCAPGDTTTSWVKYASAEYFKNNAQLPVLFHDAIKEVPTDAILIKLSPWAFLQSELKDSLSASHEIINPVSSGGGHQVSNFCKAVGQMYNAGLDVKMTSLYPKVSLPVSVGTPFISPLIKWEHSQSWKTHIMNYPLVSLKDV